MTSFIGIDPGLDGAVALYRPESLTGPATLQILDMPTYTLKNGAGKKKRRLDLSTLARWFDINGLVVKLAAIEDVHSMPGEGVSSAFKFGFNCGVAQMAVASCFIPVHLVTPQKWKAYFKLTSDKDASRHRAASLMPAFSGFWTRKMDDGRAEAALLALYASRVHAGEQLLTGAAA